MMTRPDGGIVVGVLGQWASGKTEAARTLIRHLGGRGEVVFLTDRVLFASQAVDHILELEDSKVQVGMEDDGRKRLDSELVTIWLRPGEDLRTVDPASLDFFVYDDQVLYAWRKRAKVELGPRIRETSAEGKPVVIEVSFGPNVEPQGEDHYGRTISDLFARLVSAGVEPWQVRWIIVEAGFEKRSERNERRHANIPVGYFEKFGADGGDLEPEQLEELEREGTIIRRIPNEHDDVERFRADIIAAFEEMFRRALPARAGDGNREQR
jgi:hypothetical protein